MSRVVLQGVGKRYGPVTALEALDLVVEEGECVTLLGPSGCGKTTTLRLVAGFIEPSAGRILMDGHDVTRIPPQKRAIGMVFQDYALFPHLSVEENIAFGLRERGASRETMRSRVAELLDLVRLPDIARRYPAELSGGQQQRVAVARAVAYPPRVLLMDEPLGALDLKLREAMQVELRRIQQALRITTIYVTHDQTEAMSLSDRIAVMNQGRLEQLASARTIYERPRSRFVAAFVGKINFLPAKVSGRDGAWSLLDVGESPVRALELSSGPPGGLPGPPTLHNEVTLAIRPERLALVPEGAPADGKNVLNATVEAESFAGNLLHVTVRTGNGTPLIVEVRPGDLGVRIGDRVRVAWAPDQATVLAD
jgi:spermidine/putrescine ABC transporter ATP-binding subunit